MSPYSPCVRASWTCLLAASSLLWLGDSGGLRAQPKKETTHPVSFEVTKLKVSDTGIHTFTLVVKIASGWKMYGNPIGNKDAAEERLEIKGPEAARDVQIKYPAGEVVHLPHLDGYLRIYRGTLHIPVRFRVPRNPRKPLAITVTYYATPEFRCGVIKTIRLTLR